MARIRTIKPEFFTSADVCDLSPLARLLYIATWCEADREGRLVWNLRTLKIRYLPADDCDIEELAGELVRAGLVVVYEVDGKTYATIPTFAAHQHVNPREAQSILPAPPTIDASARVSDASLRVSDAQVGKERKGKEGKGKEGKRDSVDEAPASPTPPVQMGELIPLGADPDRLTPERVVAIWNEATGGRIREITADRRASIRKAIAANPDPEVWRSACRTAAALRDLADTRWLTLDWLTSRKDGRWNVARVAEGEFDWKLNPTPGRDIRTGYVHHGAADEARFARAGDVTDEF